MRSERQRFLKVLLLSALLYAPTVRHRNLSDCGGSSRMATVESLVERGTFAIEGSSFAYTCDKMTRDGHVFSDKPPLLSIASALVYAVLHDGAGLRFNRESIPGRTTAHDHTYALMTLLVVVTAQALLVASVDGAAGRLGLGSLARALVVLAVAFATPLWTLTALFNPHNVAALLVFVGFERGLLARRPLPAGLCLGLAACVDLPLGLVALVLVMAASRAPLRMLLGALGPLLLLGLLNRHIVGDLLPIQMHRELYTAETGHTGDSATGFAQDQGLLFYAARNLAGSLGVFALTPLLVLAPLLALRVAREPGRARAAACAALGLFAASLVLFVVVWPEAVGCSYGMRHITPALPPLLLIAGAGLRTDRDCARFAALGLVSAVLAGGGLLSPATCAGFRSDRGALVPARVFFSNLGDVLLPRLGRH